MKEKMSNKIKNFWNENKSTIKVGLVCGVTGVMYGMIKGANTATKIICTDAYKAAIEDEQKDLDETPEVVEDVTVETF